MTTLDETSLTHAGGVVRRTKKKTTRYLVVESRSTPGHWVLPKGHIERGETPEQTAVREIEEEAGVHADVIEWLGTSSYDRFGKDICVSYYVLDYVEDVPPKEDRDCRWCTLDEAVELLSFDDTREMVRAAAMIS